MKALENRVKNNFLDAVQTSIAFLFSKTLLNEEAKYELKEIVEMENKFDRMT